VHQPYDEQLTFGDPTHPNIDIAFNNHGHYYAVVSDEIAAYIHNGSALRKMAAYHNTRVAADFPQYCIEPCSPQLHHKSIMPARIDILPNALLDPSARLSAEPPTVNAASEDLPPTQIFADSVNNNQSSMVQQHAQLVVQMSNQSTGSETNPQQSPWQSFISDLDEHLNGDPSMNQSISPLVNKHPDHTANSSDSIDTEVFDVCTIANHGRITSRIHPPNRHLWIECCREVLKPYMLARIQPRNNQSITQTMRALVKLLSLPGKLLSRRSARTRRKNQSTTRENCC
jgi:hypothetical protein